MATYRAGYAALAPFDLGAPFGLTAASVWYPSSVDVAEGKQKYLGSFVGRAALRAPGPPVGKRLPLCLLLHGLRGTTGDLSWLGERLARAGVVSVAFAQPGVHARSYDPQLAPQLWRRAAMARQAITFLWAHPVWGAHLAGGPIVLAGHSAGGSAAFVVAGAAVDAGQFQRRYTGSGPVPAPVPPDPRVHAIVALAPGTGEVFADAGMAKVGVPCLIVSGGRDVACPDRFNAARYAAAINGASWHRLPKAGHFVFKPTCTWYGKLRAPAICVDGCGVRRSKVHDDVAMRTLQFMSAHKLFAVPIA